MANEPTEDDPFADVKAKQAEAVEPTDDDPFADVKAMQAEAVEPTEDDPFADVKAMQAAEPTEDDPFADVKAKEAGEEGFWDYKRDPKLAEGNFAGNLYDNLKDLPGHLFRAAAGVTSNVIKEGFNEFDIGMEAYKEGGLNHARKAVKAAGDKWLTEDVLPTAGAVIKAGAKGIKDTILHPFEMANDRPLETLANVVSLGTVGGAAVKGVTSTAKAAKAAAPALRAVGETAAKEAAEGLVAMKPQGIVEHLVGSRLSQAEAAAKAAPEALKAVKPVAAAAAKGLGDVALRSIDALSPIPLTYRPSVASEALRPSAAPARIARTISGTPLGDSIGSWLLDPTAAVPKDIVAALRDSTDRKPAKKAQAADRIREALRGLSDEDQALTRDLLASEAARDVMPNLPNQVSQLQNDIGQALGGIERRAASNPEAAARIARDGMEAVRAKAEGVYTRNALKSPAAQAVKAALEARPLRFVDETGRDLGGLEYMLSTTSPKIDASKIKMEVNPAHPQAADAARLKDKLEEIRRVFAGIAEEANSIDAGPITFKSADGALTSKASSKLLPDAAFRRHLAYYTPDVYKTPSKGLGDMFAEASGSPFHQASLKHDKGFADRVAYGASDKFGFAAISAAHAAINDIERFKVLETVAKKAPAVTGEALAKLPLEARAVLTKDQYTSLGAKAGEYIEVPHARLPESDMSKWGALSGKYVTRPTWNYIQAMDLAAADARYTNNAIFKALARFRGAWVMAKVVDNIPSHVNNLIGNVMHVIADGGILATPRYAKEIGKAIFGRAVLGTAKNQDPFFKAAESIGLVNAHNLREAADAMGKTASREGLWAGLVEGITKAVKSGGKSVAVALKDRAQSIAKEDGLVNKSLAVYETGVRDNPIAEALATLYGGVEDGTRLAIFRRNIKAMAHERGITVTEALADADVLAAAKHKVEQYAFRYDDVPLALQYADKYGIGLAFSRYGWKSVGALADLAVTQPAMVRNARTGAEMYYDGKNETDKEFLDKQPAHTMGRMLPLNDFRDLGRVLPGTTPEDFDNKALDARYYTPYGLPLEVLGIKPKGSYGPAQYRSWMNTAADVTSGPFSGIIDNLRNQDPITGKDFTDDRQRAKALVYSLAPGLAYHVNEKLLPAWEADAVGTVAHDKRGRELTLADAALHNAGLRVEERQDGRVDQATMRGAKDRAKELKNTAREAINKALTPEQEQKAYDEHYDEHDNLMRMVQEKLNPRRK